MNAPTNHTTLDEKTSLDLARQFLLGEVMAAAMKQLRAADKPWLRMPEEAQQRVIREVRDEVTEAIRRAVQLIASDARTVFRADVESVTFKDGVKAVLTMANTEASHELADVAGGSVYVVIEDPTRYTQGSSAVPKAQPEQAEDLEWSRVNRRTWVIDFNVPGRTYTNKKRCKDFPVPDEFKARLESWYESRKDEYVIGLGPRGAVSTTYHEAAYVVRELAGLKDPTLVPRHCMRKMYATEMFEREVNPEVVGHLLADNPDTLRKSYVKFKDSVLRAAANVRSRAPVEIEMLR